MHLPRLSCFVLLLLITWMSAPSASAVSWQPVMHPNNTATLYARITLNGIPAQSDDLLAAFCEDVCRGLGQIHIHQSEAYSTILINLAQAGESITFKLYSAQQNAVYSMDTVLQADFAQCYGSDFPILLNAISSNDLDIPYLQIHKQDGQILLCWDEVLGASHYLIYSSADPHEGFQLLGSSSELFWLVEPSSSKLFFYVKAAR